MSARTSPVEEDVEGTIPGPGQRRRRRKRTVAHGRAARPGPERLHRRAAGGAGDPRSAGTARAEPTLEQPAVTVPAAADESSEVPPVDVGGSEVSPAPRGAGAGPDGGRRAVREARRHRRRVAWACVVVVAACLVATVLVLGMARDRRPPRPAGLPPAAAAAAVSAPAHAPTSSGAPAPEGGDTT